MEIDKKNFIKYAAKVFGDRLKERGISQYRFIKNNPKGNPQTLSRIITGANTVRCTTLAGYAEAIGLELVLRDKETKEVYENTSK